VDSDDATFGIVANVTMMVMNANRLPPKARHLRSLDPLDETLDSVLPWPVSWRLATTGKANIHSPAPLGSCGADLEQARITLPQGYVDAATTVIEEQLAKAGYRLAYVLNRAGCQETGSGACGGQVPGGGPDGYCQCSGRYTTWNCGGQLTQQCWHDNQCMPLPGAQRAAKGPNCN